ncbi:DEAD/DEAH box helicase family protein [Microbacterium sp. ARD31]|uniref:DEAD/DEAH box helicase family protein n=1 Tax=Microbacterium sp. ARD31 TaxID=2962576 RepID=UPI002881A76A|nr:DEAD/DEAH box helicase family protein [Microbacterium sp. ARD31]MDT0185300.1 DEAD/DEAH box helicase family protein [Microbacterium sp. ARD31]
MPDPDASVVPPLRVHQREALEALADAWRDDHQPRAWVVLPPGAGKTRVGIEAVAAEIREHPDTRAVVLAPNTAIQSQWIAEARAMGLDASDDKALTSDLTCLTYQSLAVFDSEAADDDDSVQSVVDRLHPNGVELFERIRSQPRLVLVLDECHHLLEVWGQLLAELLEAVDRAHVLALTATPPESLVGEQRALVDRLFGTIRYRVSVPAVVKEGHLAPFDELVWLTTPTPTEEDWLTTEAVRFTELTTLLTTPGFGTVGFYAWLTARFVEPVPATTTWASLAEREPELCDAALRMHHAGLLALPAGARLREEHRHAPSADDWVRLLGDWLLRHVAESDDPADAEVLATVRAALPSVGYQWTRRGVRRGRSTVDRVLARSYAKPGAAAQIIAAEHAVLGDRARVLVLCDHERASATVPVTLDGVQDAEAGSALAALEVLLSDPSTAVLNPMLVTGSVVAGSKETLQDLIAFVAARDPELAARLRVEAGSPVATCSSGWTSRTWVAHVTAYLEAGRTQVLVGTRSLLGEGWNARGVSTLIDLTTATTLTAVVQTRGRALRTDPTWPDKVATNWTVVCVSEAHPKGDNDWMRLVRKHQGFHGIDADGDIVDGVAHIDASFSPFAPPPVASFDALNARMLVTAADRDAIRDAWRVGEPYDDVTLASLRVRPASPALVPAEEVVTIAPVAPTWRLETDGLTTSVPVPDTSWRTPMALAAGTAGASAAATVAGPWALLAAGGLGVLATLGQAVVTGSDHTSVLTSWVRSQVALTSGTPALEAVAAAVADGLLAGGLTSVGASALAVDVHPGGEYRFRLVGTEADAEVYASAFDEAIGPVGASRYVVSRYTDASLPDGPIRTRRGARAALRAARATGEVWHPVPTVLGRNATLAGHYLAAWCTWVGEGRLLAAAKPEGAGIVAAVSGDSPFAATTVMRRTWS